MPLRKWAGCIGDWLSENRDVHVYFDNDAEGAAPRNAHTPLEMLRQAIGSNLRNTKAASVSEGRLRR